MARRGSLCTVASDSGFQVEPASLITELERGDEGSGFCPALLCERATQRHLWRGTPVQVSCTLPPASASLAGRRLFEFPSEAITQLCPEAPGKERKSSKTNQIQILK